MLTARRAAIVETVLIVAGFVVLYSCLPHILAGDDNTRINDIDQLLRVGHLTSSKYSLVMPLASAPLLALSYAGIGTLEGWAAHFNVIVVALGTIAAFRLLRGRVDAGTLRRCVLVVLFLSFMTNRLRDYNAEVFTATLVTVGLIAVVTGRHALLGWAAVVIGVVNTPAAFVALAFVVVLRAFWTRRFRPLLALVAAAVLIMGEAWLRRGSPFTSGYESDFNNPSVLPYSHHAGFSYPIVLGIFAILFSFGRGLLFYTPGLALWLDRRTRTLVTQQQQLIILLLAFVAGLVVVYAHWWAWYAGLTWGPRFFPLAAIVSSVLIAVRLRDTASARAAALTLGVLTLSGWVAVAGGLNDFSLEYFCEQKNNTLLYLCWDTPEFSSLWWPVRHFPDLTPRLAVFALFCAVVYAYLAAPLVARIVAGVAPLWRDRAWARGWSF